jgi:MFS family permease
MTKESSPPASIDKKNVSNIEYIEVADPSISKFEDSNIRDENGNIKSAAEIWPHIDNAKLLRKMDWHLIPMVTLLYFMSYLDRTNIGNAAIEGLVVDLKLTGNKFNLCLTVFFFTYAFFEIPSNMILKKVRPSIWLPSIVLAWGVVMTLMGIVQSYHGLLIARIFLGITEAGLFPGIAYYLTQWYRRQELQFRQALFYSATTLAGAFSGLLAFGIAKMNGVAGLAGWRWIFILEGIATVVVALFAFWGMNDYPETAKFLTEEERVYLIHKLKYDANSSKVSDASALSTDEDGLPDIGNQPECTEEGSRYFKQAFTDWQVYLAIIMFWASVIPSYAISMFLPTILKSLGFSRTKSQLLTVPIYSMAAVSCVVQAKLSDRVGKRSPFIIGNFLIMIIGFAAVIGLDPVAKSMSIYGCVYIIGFAMAPAFPGIISWHANNLSGSYKRAIAMAFQIGAGNLGGAVASNIYRAADAPHYKLGHGIALGMCCTGVVTGLILLLGYNLSNKRKIKQWKSGKYNDYTMEELSQLGDKSPLFKYRY